MVDSTSDAIVADPQAVIQTSFGASLKESTPSIASDFNIPKVFEEAFFDVSQVEKIPRLDALPVRALHSGKLVRFLGMVQDTSYAQEIYVGMTKSQTKWSLHRYGYSDPTVVDINSPDVVLDERCAIYVTSIPGCARWFENPESLEGLSLEDATVLKGDKDRVEALGQKEVGIIVKCYCGLENTVKVCDLVEILGILEMPEENDEDMGVVVHAVTMRKKQLNEIILAKQGQLSTTDLAKAKDLFIQHLSYLFEGDTLAAKSVLLNLSASLTHRNTIPLGPLPMNIYSTPPDVIAKVTGFLRSILPAVVVESMSIKSLNSERIYPKSDGETLSAGRGQLVARTTLVIDDSKMLEGKLQDTGVRNLRFLSRVATAQKLGFEFPYHEFETDTDISVLVLGTSKTILPVPIAFNHIKKEAAASVVSQEHLQLLRTYLAQISTLTISIDENVADQMQNSFVCTRKETHGEGVNETWFGTRIIVAKGLARISARENVSCGDWSEALEVCAQWESRRKRVAQEGMGPG